MAMSRAPSSTVDAAPTTRSPVQHTPRITHHAPGEALITCVCRRLRRVIDVDDEHARDFVLWEHLHRHIENGQLPVEDARTGRLYAVTAASVPDLLLIISSA
jgi:hypothetical protein